MSEYKLNKTFNKIFKFLGVLTIVLCAATLLYPFINASVTEHSLVLAIAIPGVLISFGYLLQALYSKIIRFKSVEEDVYFSTDKRYFYIENAAPCIVIAIVAGYMAMNKFVKYVELDRYSLIPYLIMIAVIAFIVIGIVLWFYPFENIIGSKTSLFYIIIFFASFVLTSIVSSLSTLFPAICLLFYIMVMIFILNQGNITKAFSKSGLGFASAQVRMKNLILSVFVFICIITALVITYNILSFLAPVARLIIFFVLGRLLSKGDIRKIPLKENLPNSDMEFKPYKIEGIPGAASVIMLLLILVFASSIIILFIFNRNRLREILQLIGDFFEKLIESLTNIFKFKPNIKEDDFLPSNYTDEIIDIKPQSNNSKSILFRSYKDFLINLENLKSNHERLIYSYAVLVSLLRLSNYNVKISDTPREIEYKIGMFDQETELSNVTDIYEHIRYDIKHPESTRLDQTLEETKNLVKTYSKFNTGYFSKRNHIGETTAK